MICYRNLIKIVYLIIFYLTDSYNFHQQIQDFICGTQVIDDPSLLKFSQHCTVIEGNLYLMSDFYANDNIKGLINLQEITGSLVVSSIFYTPGQSLQWLLPRLSVIRGNPSIGQYSLVIIDTFLTSLELTSLSVISNGGVFIHRNPQLCHVDKIDWSVIAKNASFYLGGHSDICVNKCPGSFCQHCWSSRACQMNCSTDCPGNCHANYHSTCCHDQCLGGCSATGPRNCVACRNLKHEGECIAACPQDYYELNGRYCVTENQCLNTPVLTDRIVEEAANIHLLSQKGQLLLHHQTQPRPSNYSILAKECVAKCPEPTHRRDPRTGHCKFCINKRRGCLYDCPAIRIKRLEDIDQAAGCISIESLYINLYQYGKHIHNELEEAFHSLEEIKSSLVIVRSYYLMSLSFLKNLKVIRGFGNSNESSVIIWNNHNLQALWNIEPNSGLLIQSGKVEIGQNSVLCPQTIRKFLSRFTWGMSQNLSLHHVINNFNGNRASCNIHFVSLSINQIRPTSVRISYRNPGRKFSSSTVLLMVKSAENRNNTTEEKMARCDAAKQWKVIVTEYCTRSESICYYNIRDLKPATKYAIYVESEASEYQLPFRSNITYFDTRPTRPKPPEHVEFRAQGDDTLRLVWKPPSEPNGIITKYIIALEKLSIDPLEFMIPDGGSSLAAQKYLSSRMKHLQTNINGDYSKCTSCKSCDRQCRNSDNSRNNVLFKSELVEEMVLLDLGMRVMNWDKIHWKNFTSRYKITPTWFDDSPNSTISLSSSPVSFDDMYEDSSKISNPPRIDDGSNIIHEVPGHTNFLLIENLEHYTEYVAFIRACHDFDDFSSLNESDYEEYYNTAYKDDYGTVLGKEKIDRGFIIDSLCSRPVSSSAKTDGKAGVDNVESGYVTVLQLGHGNVDVFWLSPPHPNGLIVLYTLRYRIRELNRSWLYKRVTLKNWYDKGAENQNSLSKFFSNITTGLDKRFGGTSLTNLVGGDYEVMILATSLAGNGSWSALHYFSINNRTKRKYWLFITGGLILILFILFILFLVFWWIFRNRKRSLREGWTTVNNNYLDLKLNSLNDWKILHSDIELFDFTEPVGKGCFGEVYRGRLKKLSSMCGKMFPHIEVPCDVAFKTLQQDSDPSDREDRKNELLNMSQLHSYNIVQFLGYMDGPDTRNASQTYLQTKLRSLSSSILKLFNLRHHRYPHSNKTTFRSLRTTQIDFSRVFLVPVMEYMSKGNLLTYIRDQALCPEGIVQESYIYRWAAQIADGMAYLGSKNTIHRDLAARNCLVNDNFDVKISDFGLARNLERYDYYLSTVGRKLPIRWMPSECMEGEQSFSIKSDVWSYGTVLWEIVTQGSRPYQGLSNDEVRVYVTRGKNPGNYHRPPERCPTIILEIMVHCWAVDYHDRPQFSQILDLLKPFLEESFFSKSWYYDNSIADS